MSGRQEEQHGVDSCRYGEARYDARGGGDAGGDGKHGSEQDSGEPAEGGTRYVPSAKAEGSECRARRSVSFVSGGPDATHGRRRTGAERDAILLHGVRPEGRSIAPWERGDG